MKSSKTIKTDQNISLTHQQYYCGPIPDPDSLAKYESISPGFANRLLVMAEIEQSERIKTQNKIIDVEKQIAIKDSNNFKRGQIFAIIAVIFTVIYNQNLFFV